MQKSVQDLTREIHAHFSVGQLDKVLPYLHDDVSVTAFAFGITLTGKDGFMGFMKSFTDAFPDIKLTHDLLIAEGGRVAVEFTGEGTHTGPLATPGGVIPPTGKKVIFKVAEFLLWENGKLRSLHNYQDSASIMRQLGLIP